MTKLACNLQLQTAVKIMLADPCPCAVGRAPTCRPRQRQRNNANQPAKEHFRRRLQSWRKNGKRACRTLRPCGTGSWPCSFQHVHTQDARPLHGLTNAQRLALTASTTFWPFLASLVFITSYPQVPSP